MVFNSFQFIVFFAAVLALRYALPHGARWVMLLLASWLFYMAWSPLFILLILAVTLCNYLAARLLSGGRAWPLWAAAIADMGVLAAFKYSAFLNNTLAAAFARVGVHYPVPAFDVILPLGVSFYTFQALAYVVDVRRGKVPAERNFFKLSLFISFFPLLVAGPIERTGDLTPQLFAKRRFEWGNIVTGLQWLALGFFKKIVIADRLAAIVNTAYGAPFYYRGLSMLLATAAFSFQLYCDFSGYSDIAKGCAKMLGIDATQNFRSPYFASDMRDFWRRWHISLSSWFKDYVYIPLGGSRAGKWRGRVNVMATFLLSGLWHGASWTFVIWGGLNGLFQVAQDFVKIRIPRWLAAVGVFWLYTFTLVFFRAQSTRDALFIFRHLFDNWRLWGDLFSVHYMLLAVSPRLTELIIAAGCIVFLCILDFFGRRDSVPQALARAPAALRFAAYFILCTAIMTLGVYHGGGTFIYFQF